MLDYNPIATCTVGERYEADVPDTLNLAHRMGLAVNALTNVWYPEEKWALGFVVDFSRRPAVLFPRLDVDSYLPYEGKVVLHIKKLGESAVLLTFDSDSTSAHLFSRQLDGQELNFGILFLKRHK